MPFFFVFVGILLIVTGVKDTHVALGKQVVKDFTGKQNFWTWVLALGCSGALGYVDRLKPFANAFMVLVLLAMVLSNSNRGDILTRIGDGLNNPVKPDRGGASTASAGNANLPRADITSIVDAGKTAAANTAPKTTYLQDANTLLSMAAKAAALFGF